MTSIISSHHCSWSHKVHDHSHRGKFHKIRYPGCSGPHFLSLGSVSSQNQHLGIGSESIQSGRRCAPIFSSAVDDNNEPDDLGDDSNDKQSPKDDAGEVNSEILRENLERIVGTDDSSFSGIDLATLIRNKYGRSYDVQLIKKEFMGRNLLALNVMWKYMEQAVSIFIDMDESGGRANEWIYK